MAPSSTDPSAHSPEFQEQINEVQVRLTEFIEATRPAHDANLRRAAALHSPSGPEERNDQPKAPRPPRNTTNPTSALDRHSRKCRICNHPERDLIEADFLDWGHAERIAREFKVAYSAIYRHARAAGLIERRRQNLCPAVEKVLESVEYVEQPSAFAILRAVRTLACLTGARNWTEPPTTHVVINTTQPSPRSLNPVTTSDDALVEPVLSLSATEPTPSSSATVAVQSASHSSLVTSHCISNRHTYEKLELDVTDTKQTSEVSSNRHKM